MYILLWPILLLPVLEIVGFVTIGADLGVGMTLLWLFGTGWLGFYLLQSRGRSAWERAAKAQQDDIFARRDLFDGIAIFIASLLLIFPGFISDFLAVPFLLAPLRNKIFDLIGKNPQSPFRKSASETVLRTARRTTTIIEGEFTKIDDK